MLLAVGTLVLSVGLFAGCGLLDGDEQAEEVAGWPPPADLVTRGSAVYEANCAVCHGANGEGEPNWKVQNDDLTYPAPPHDETGHTWHHADELLFEIVRDGGSQLDSSTFRSRMPAWGEVLSDEEIQAVIIYLKTLWGPEERAFQAEVSEGNPFPLDAP